MPRKGPPSGCAAAQIEKSRYDETVIAGCCVPDMCMTQMSDAKLRVYLPVTPAAAFRRVLSAAQVNQITETFFREMTATNIAATTTQTTTIRLPPMPVCGDCSGVSV